MSYEQIRQYSHHQEKSASRLIEMAILLERCAQFLQQVIIAIPSQDYEKRFEYTDKVIVILNSLQGTLAIHHSEEAKAFHEFFSNAITLLVQVNLKEDPQLCLKIREKLLEMANLWRDADKTNYPSSKEPHLDSTNLTQDALPLKPIFVKA